ncbi:PREDICTED: gamma-secretase subunit Aph-1b-like, partial [Charadrius vociferus]|uniref:gamma-secretase subunit Aph-1b-like n=1 Tax=Charadrius vociferus TaxID=50402 RepID=UPI0005212DE3
FMTMVLIFLHTFWGILFFHGCEHRCWWEITAVVVMHLTVSGSTFCNPLYMGSLVPSYLLMATAATWAYLLSGGSAQNLLRFLLCKSCSVYGEEPALSWNPEALKAIEGLVALSEDGCSPISIQQMAYVAVVGFGLMSGAFSMINLLADALGPGTVGIHGDSQLYFLTSAFMTMVLIFLHTFWGILFFHGCEHRCWWEITAVVVMHLTVSGS